MNETNRNPGMDARRETYNRLQTSLEIGRGGVRPEEGDIARFFWDQVLGGIDWGTAPPMALMLAEEALVLRVTAVRLLRQFQNDTLMKERNTGPDVLCPTVDSWTKIQEKFRKVTKELLEQYGGGNSGGVPNLAAALQPLLEEGEEVLNGLLSVEDGENTIEELGEEFRNH